MIRRMLSAALVSLAMLAAWGPTSAAGPALEPGYLELKPYNPDAWHVIWRKPAVGGSPMRIDAVLPESCAPRRGPAPVFDGTAFATGWVTVCADGLAGGRVGIEGLAETRTDVLVRYGGRAGDVQFVRLTASEPAFVVLRGMGTAEIFATDVAPSFYPAVSSL